MLDDADIAFDWSNLERAFFGVAALKCFAENQ